MSEHNNDYPLDLVDAERERQALQSRLRAIPLKPWTDGAGVEHRSDPSWTPELEEQGEALQEALRDVCATTSTHPYWATVKPEERSDARMHLKKIAAQATTEKETSAA